MPTSSKVIIFLQFDLVSLKKIYIYFSLDRTGDSISQRSVLQVHKHGEPGEGGHDDKVLVKNSKRLVFIGFFFQ